MHQIRRTNAKRKLLSQAVLANVELKRELGVPLSLIVRQLELGMSRTALAALLKWYRLLNCKGSAYNQYVIHESLFPSWLDQQCAKVQENPQGWVYIDRFPFGYWTYNADNKTVY